MESFTVLRECPALLAVIGNQQNMTNMISLLVDAFCSQLPSQAISIKENLRPPQMRKALLELISSKVKLLVFLVTLLRTNSASLRQYQKRMPEAIVQLLAHCPHSDVATRKELLQNTRFVISVQDLKADFQKHISTFLDEKTIVGDAQHSENRALAYGLIAELVHLFRVDMTPPDMAKAVCTFSLNLHDMSLALGTQSTSARLLMHLVEGVYSNCNNPTETIAAPSRQLLIRIFDTFVRKFRSIAKYAAVLEDIKNAGDALKDVEIGIRLLPFRSSLVKDSQFDAASEIKTAISLFRGSLLAVRTVMWSVSSQKKRLRDKCKDLPEFLTEHGMLVEQEAKYCRSLLKHGIQCFKLSRGTPEERDLLDVFASVFAVLDTQCFMDVFCEHIDLLFTAIVENDLMICIPQHYLAGKLSKTFLEVLMSYLVPRLRAMGEDNPAAGVMHRMFKISIGSVTLFPDNESILRHHVQTIALGCLKSAQDEQRPHHFLSVLKALFRSVVSGKSLDVLHKEFIPIAKTLLDGFHKMLQNPSFEAHRDSIVDLCLSIPVRITYFLSHMYYQTKPVIMALNGSPETVATGLKKLEQWIDSLPSTFIHSILQPIASDLMKALHKQLALPSHHNLSLTTVRILGKLGGGNRQLISDFLLNESVPEKPSDVTVFLKWTLNETAGPASLPISLTQFAVVALDTIKTSKDPTLRRAVLTFCRCVTPVLLQSIYKTMFQELKGFSEPGVKQEKDRSPSLISQCLKTTANEMQRFSSVSANMNEGSRPSSVVANLESWYDALRMISLAVVIGSQDSSSEFPLLLDKLAIALSQHAVQSFDDQSKISFPQFYLPHWKFTCACVIDAISTDNKATSEAGVVLLRTFVRMLNDSPPSTHIPIANEMVRSCCQLGFEREHWKKIAFCSGIRVILEEVSVDCVRPLENSIIRAIFFLWKDSQTEEIVSCTEAARTTFVELLTKCYFSSSEGKMEVGGESPVDASFQAIIDQMFVELHSPSQNVRRNVQSMLKLVATRLNKDLSELLIPFKNHLFKAIPPAKLKQATMPSQLGFIDSLVFILSLPTPVISSIDADLCVCLEDAYQIAEMDDSYLMKQNDPRQIMQLQALRCSCVELLCAAMCSPHLNLCENLTDLRDRVILLFFKVLSKGPKDALAFAKTGLNHVLNTNPNDPKRGNFKELLQNSLRPVLAKLSDYKKLSVQLLEGLARLLELLAHCFNNTLGDKLIEYLKNWLDPEHIACFTSTAMGKPSKPGEELKIAVAITKIFHCLPPSPERFLQPLVDITLKLEMQIPEHVSFSYIRSPYREPLCMFLNKYADLSCEFFIPKFSDRSYFRLFLSCIKMALASSLREALIMRMETLISSATLGGRTDETAAYNFVCMVAVFIEFDPAFLQNNPLCLKEVLRLWADRRMSKDEGPEMPLQVISQTQKLVTCLTSYVRTNPSDKSVLFQLLSAFPSRSVVDLSVTKHFLVQDFACGSSIEVKKAFLSHFIDSFVETPPGIVNMTISQDLKCQIIIFIVSPMMSTTLQVSALRDQLMDPDTCKLFVKTVLEPSEVTLNSYNEPLRVELLQLATILIRFMSQGLVSLRKELIKFAWDHLKRDESICKQWAYVNVCYFIQQYEAPHKIIIQVYVALLRLFNQEVKVLQKVALDVLTPMLPSRLNAGEGRMPHWIKFTRKIVGDESQNPAHLIQIWQFMVRHPKLFYPYRHMFINNMGSSISKLGSPQPQSMDQKKVAIDLIELIFDWEQIRIQGGDVHSDAPSANSLTQEEIGSRRSRDEDFANMDIGEPGISRRRMEDSVLSSDNVPSAQSSVSAASGSGNDNVHAFVPCQQLVDIIMNFLLRFTVMYSVEPQNQQQTNRSLQQLIRGLSVWKNRQINIKLHYMERLISTADQSVHLQSAVDVVSHLWKHPFIGPSLVCDTGLKVLAKIVQVSAACDSLPVVSSLCDLVKKVLPHCSDVEAAQSFQTTIGAFITAGLEHADRVRVLNALLLLKAISSSEITRIDPYCSTISKLLKKYTQEHMSDLFNYSQRRSDNPADQVLAEQLSHLLILLIELLASRITELGEHRKYLLNSIVMLIERSSEVSVLKAIINILKEWVKDPVATGVTAKECSTLVIKMAPLEQMRDPSPFDEFLQMIMNIHGEGSVCDATVKQKTEKCFTFGLKSSDPALQRQFFQHLSLRAPTHAFGRLKYILGEQEWDGVGDIFWLEHASELMLAIADKSSSLIPAGQPVTESIASLLGDLTSGDLLPALSILVHRSPTCARRLWLDMFPSFWRLFSSEQQTALGTPLCALLVHDHSPKQQQRRPNVVQVLLESAELCEPRPPISIQYLRYVGKTYNAWHAVLPVLEDLSAQHAQAHSASSDAMGDGSEKISDIHAALEELYEALEETDCLHALHRRRCKNPETLYGLSCVQFSFWQKAQDVIHQQMCKGFAMPASTEEQSLLDSFWVQCCRHLNQWDILHEFSRKVRSHDLMLESSWKQQDWTSLRDNLGNPNQADPQQTKIYEVYSALQENNTQDASKHCMESSQYALKRWIGLSGISSQAYVPLLQKFHTFVELEESCSIIDEVQKAIRVNPPSNHVPDIKPFISAWRERLPNIWDDLTVWSDIIRMRVNVFRSLADCQSANSELKQVLSTLCNGEIFENTIKFCDAARKQRFLDVALAALAKIPAPKSSDLNQTFQLQRQDFKCRYRMSAAERANGLIRLHRIDLDKFSTAQRAELLYLKGKFQMKEVSISAAQESFGTAVTMLESTAKYWIAWGNTFDQQLKASGPAGASLQSEQGARYAEHFIRCILRAVRLQPEAAKLLLSRVIFLLQCEPANAAILDAFSSGVDLCPSWVWLFLLPQILRVVEGPSRSAVVKILTKVSVDYPQAVFLQIRKLLKSMLPVRQSASAAAVAVKVESAASGISNGNGMADSSASSSSEVLVAVAAAEPVELDPQQIIMKVWGALQDHHKSIVKESEIFVNEIIRLRPSSEMNLASTLWTWLDEVGRHDMRNPYPHEMLKSYCENLLEMCNTANCIPEVAAERARFAAEFGAPLNEDFGKGSLMYAASADKAPIGKDVYRILGKWCGALEKYWSMRDPRIHLESFAPSLLEFKGSQMEFVGQYESLSEPSPDSHFKLDRVLPRAQYVVRHGNCCFRLLFRGSDGRIRPYLVMNVRAMTTDDRWHQYRHVVNNALLKSRQSRCRYLSVHSVTTVLITSRLRMVADFERSVNLGQVLRTSLSHISPPTIALRHIEELMSNGNVTAAYQSVSLAVPHTLLRDHVSKLVGSVSHLWMLRRAFATHYGLNLIFGYSLCSTPSHADRLTFSLDSGHIFYQEVRPSFDSKFCLKSKYPIPFRFTPNIVSFLQPVCSVRLHPPPTPSLTPSSDYDRRPSDCSICHQCRRGSEAQSLRPRFPLPDVQGRAAVHVRPQLRCVSPVHQRHAGRETLNVMAHSIFSCSLNSNLVRGRRRFRCDD